jgi:glutamate 5-kinase
LIRAPLLVLLSDVDGLYDGDPADPASRRIPTVTQLDDSVMALARDRATGVGKGGMSSKLEAARIATASGENVVIASGRKRGVLTDILRGRPIGTWIMARGQAVNARKRWIGFAAQPRGQVVVDAGAYRAIGEQNGSLLAIGIVEVIGQFNKGDVVGLKNPDGQEFARGLTNYPASEIRRIEGLRTDQIAGALGHRPYDEVIHRDNLLVSA